MLPLIEFMNWKQMLSKSVPACLLCCQATQLTLVQHMRGEFVRQARAVRGARLHFCGLFVGDVPIERVTRFRYADRRQTNTLATWWSRFGSSLKLQLGNSSIQTGNQVSWNLFFLPLQAVFPTHTLHLGGPPKYIWRPILTFYSICSIHYFFLLTTKYVFFKLCKGNPVVVMPFAAHWFWSTR